MGRWWTTLNSGSREGLIDMIESVLTHKITEYSVETRQGDLPMVKVLWYMGSGKLAAFWGVVWSHTHVIGAKVHEGGSTSSHHPIIRCESRAIKVVLTTRSTSHTGQLSAGHTKRVGDSTTFRLNRGIRE